METSAATARSILSCPAELVLAIDGRPHIERDDPWVGLEDWAGTPALICAHGGALSQAADRRADAELEVVGGIHGGETLVLCGRLCLVTSEMCGCCNGARDYITVDVVEVTLVRGEERIPVAVEDFADPALWLNEGFLRRTTAHINEHHGEHLRWAVAQRANLLASEVVAAQLVDLTSSGVEVQWVGVDGARSLLLFFPDAAINPDQLGEHLRSSLHPELC